MSPSTAIAISGKRPRSSADLERDVSKRPRRMDNLAEEAPRVPMSPTTLRPRSTLPNNDFAPLRRCFFTCRGGLYACQTMPEVADAPTTAHADLVHEVNRL